MSDREKLDIACAELRRAMARNQVRESDRIAEEWKRLERAGFRGSSSVQRNARRISR